MLKSVLIICGKILTWVNFLLPKKTNRIMFYSNLGFRDNGKALFDYMIAHKVYKNYEIIVASNDYKELNKYPNVKYTSCIRGLIYFFRTKYFFYAFGKYPIMPAKTQTIINLWHGMPLKKIGNLEPGKENNKYDFFSYVLSTSPIFDNIMEKSFNCGMNRILHFGQPRTDAMFEVESSEHPFKNYDKVFIWMPTFRVTDILHESNATKEDCFLPLLHSEKDLDVIDQKLNKSNCLLLIKLHPIQRTSGFNQKNKNNIIFIDEQFLQSNKLDLYKLLGLMDALITDYSSVYFDYLLLNRPILFTTGDIEDYKAKRGLNFDNPLSIMPGPHIDSFEKLIEEIDLLINNNDKYQDLRLSLNELLNKYVTRHNSKDIIDFCKIKTGD